jgi:flavorubredoxin
VATELLDAGALLVGSPTLNGEMFPTVADVLCYLKGLKPKGLIGAAFGSYGWSGQSIKRLAEALAEMGVEQACEPLAVKYVPTADDLADCRRLGGRIAEGLAKRPAPSA